MSKSEALFSKSSYYYTTILLLYYNNHIKPWTYWALCAHFLQPKCWIIQTFLRELLTFHSVFVVVVYFFFNGSVNPKTLKDKKRASNNGIIVPERKSPVSTDRKSLLLRGEAPLKGTLQDWSEKPSFSIQSIYEAILEHFTASWPETAATWICAQLEPSLATQWEKLIAGRDGQCNWGLPHGNLRSAC